MFYTDPDIGIIVKSNQSSKLRITYDNRQITTDVALARVDLWNAGTLPIERSDILKPVTIKTNPPARILESGVPAATRVDIIHPVLDMRDAAKGQLGVSWDILEEKDAFKLDLLFSGDATTTTLDIAYVLKGQPQVAKLSIEPRKWPDYAVIVSVIAGIVLFYFRFKKPGKRSERANDILEVLATTCVLAIVTLFGWGLLSRLSAPRLMPQNLMPASVREQLRVGLVNPYTNR